MLFHADLLSRGVSSSWRQGGSLSWRLTAVETMTPAVRDLLSITPNPEQAWCSIIFDCAVNSGMFIRMIKGDDIVIDMGGDGDDVVIPLGNVFAAAGQVMEGGSIDWQVWIWDAAEEALEKAAKSMMS